VAVLLLSIPFFTQAAYVQAAVQVMIMENHTSYIDSIGYYHVIGEVKNTGDTATRFNKIIGTFYDSGGEVVATSFTFSSIDVLASGQKSPFDLFLFDAAQSAKATSYKLSISYSPTAALPQGLEILSHNKYLDSIGWLHIVGEIKNIESGKATFVKVAATCFDSAGKVVAVGFAFSDPEELDPGQTAPFEVLIEADRAPKVKTYELQAQSNQYNIIPEFPVAVLILPIAMVLAIGALRVRLLNKRNHVRQPSVSVLPQWMIGFPTNSTSKLPFDLLEFLDPIFYSFGGLLDRIFFLIHHASPSVFSPDLNCIQHPC